MGHKGIVLVVLFFISAGPGAFAVETPSKCGDAKEIRDALDTVLEPITDGGEILRSYMVVYVRSTCGPIFVSCCSGNHNNNRHTVCGNNSNCTLSWDFNNNGSTKFWCMAYIYENSSLNNKLAYMSQWAVYGDGVPQKSATWVVDMKGTRRIKEDDLDKNDFPQIWVKA